MYNENGAYSLVHDRKLIITQEFQWILRIIISYWFKRNTRISFVLFFPKFFSKFQEIQIETVSVTIKITTRKWRSSNKMYSCNSSTVTKITIRFWNHVNKNPYKSHLFVTQVDEKYFFLVLCRQFSKNTCVSTNGFVSKDLALTRHSLTFLPNRKKLYYPLYIHI